MWVTALPLEMAPDCGTVTMTSSAIAGGYGQKNDDDMGFAGDDMGFGAAHRRIWDILGKYVR